MTCVELFYVLRLVCNLPMMPGLTVRDLHRGLRMSTFPTENHERRIDRNAPEPSRKLCPAIESTQMDISFHPRILNRVLGIVAVSRDPMGYLECSARVSRP